MELIFVDTAAWIALLDASDEHHESASKIFDELNNRNVRLVTTEFVLLELGDGFSAIGKRDQVVVFTTHLRSSEILTIAPVSQELIERAWELFAERKDKKWQMTDCTSFITMRDMDITTAFTTDRHFTQAGFQKLM